MTIYDALKDAATLLKELQRMDLYEALLNVREELQGIREENLRLRGENRNLREQVEVQQTIDFDKGIYWVRNDPFSKEKTDTPVCPRCWDVDKKIVRGIITTREEGGRSLLCSNCGKYFDLGGGDRNARDHPFIVR
ncbi:MAG: DNA replication initiation control protein YabA [candidate division Zixibacteria bacterium]|nr:DNA replication initiation control protein YabA [candidate division Zixibacteria bacterium]